jgi:hexokinase
MLIEKMMSGLYLGECARRILLTFAQKVELFGPVVPAKLTEPWSFSTASLSEVESDVSPLKSKVSKVLRGVLEVDSAVLNCETLYMVSLQTNPRIHLGDKVSERSLQSSSL